MIDDRYTFGTTLDAPWPTSAPASRPPSGPRASAS